MYCDDEIECELDAETRLKLTPHRANDIQGTLVNPGRIEPKAGPLRATLAELIHPHMRQALLHYSQSS